MNKHDELLRKIKALPNGNIGYQQNIPENSDLSFVECLAANDLKSLADEYEKLRERNGQLENLLRDLEPTIAYAVKATWKPEDYEAYARLRSNREE